MGPNACVWNTQHRDEFQEHRSISPSAQLTLEQVKEIIEDEDKTDKGAREVQEQLNGEEDLNPDNTSWVLNTVLNTINNKF